MNKQQELIHNCTNDHDRELMIQSLDKHNKMMSKSYFALGLAVVSFVIMFIGFKLELIWMVIPTMAIGFSSMMYTMIAPLKGVGLI